jgi:hypothetical protein
MRHVEFSADGSVVYGAAGVRVVRSTDSGRTWSERTPVTANAASNLQFLRVDPRDANVVYVVDLNQGGFRSTDGGATWVPLPTLPANTFDLAITRTTPQRSGPYLRTRLFMSAATTGRPGLTSFPLFLRVA